MYLYFLFLIIILYLIIGHNGAAENRFPIYKLCKREIVKNPLDFPELNACTRASSFGYLPENMANFSDITIENNYYFSAANMEYGEFYTAIMAAGKSKFSEILIISGFHGTTAYFLKKIYKVPVYFYSDKKSYFPDIKPIVGLPTKPVGENTLLLDFSVFAPKTYNRSGWSKALERSWEIKKNIILTVKPSKYCIMLSTFPTGKTMEISAGTPYPIPFSYTTWSAYIAVIGTEYENMKTYNPDHLYKRATFHNLCIRHKKHGFGDTKYDWDTFVCRKNISFLAPEIKKEIFKILGPLPDTHEPNYYFNSIHHIFYKPDEPIENTFVGYVIDVEKDSDISIKNIMRDTFTEYKNIAFYTDDEKYYFIRFFVKIFYFTGSFIPGVSEEKVDSEKEAEHRARNRNLKLLTLNSTNLRKSFAEKAKKWIKKAPRIWLPDSEFITAIIPPALPNQLFLVKGTGQNSRNLIFLNNLMIEAGDFLLKF